MAQKLTTPEVSENGEAHKVITLTGGVVPQEERSGTPEEAVQGLSEAAEEKAISKAQRKRRRPKPKPEQTEVETEESVPSELEQSQTALNLENANLLGQQAKALKPSKLGGLLEHQREASEALHEESPAQTASERITISPQMQSPIEGETESHESIPLLRVRLSQIANSLSPTVRSSVIPTDSDKVENIGKIVDLLETLEQMEHIDPTLSARQELTNVQDVEGNHVGSVLAESLDNAGVWGQQIYDLWMDVQNPLTGAQPTGVRESIDKTLHEAQLEMTNPSIRATNEASDVTTDVGSDGLWSPANTVRPAKIDMLDEDVAGATPRKEIEFGSKADRNFSLWDGSDSKGRKYDLMDGYTSAKPKGLTGIDAKIARSQRKLEQQQKRLQLHELKDAVTKATDLNKQIEGKT